MKTACMTLAVALSTISVFGANASAQAPGGTAPAPAPALAAAQAPATAPTPAELERGLTGFWVGALEYRDYQSNQLQQLPMQTRISLGPDGATLTRLSTFDDGPKVGNVFITTVSLFDKQGTRMTSATFRAGRDVETVSDDVSVSQWQDARHWTAVFKRLGTDGGQPAELRLTQVRQGALLKAVKEVKPVGQPDSAYVFRNQTVLNLQP